MRPLPGHVAFVVDSPTFGGAEMCVVQLLERMPGHVRRSVVASAPVPGPLAAAADRSGTLVVVRLARGTATAPDVVARALRDLSPDLAHVNLIDPATCVDALEGAVRTVPTVAQVHLTGGVPGGPGGDRLRAAYAAAAGVLAPSRPVAETVRDRLGVPADRIRRVRNGVPVPARSLRATGTGPLRIGVVARLTHQKGVDVLLDAVELLLGDGGDVEVMVAGDGRDRAALVDRARGLPVTFRGFVPDVPAFLAEVDVFCLPSRAEALPLALLEALVAGLPCVATAVGDVEEETGDLAVVVPPGDATALAAALAGLVRDPPRRAALGRRAARVARSRFRVEQTVAAVLDAYADAVQRGTVGPG